MPFAKIFALAFSKLRSMRTCAFPISMEEFVGWSNLGFSVALGGLTTVHVAAVVECRGRRRGCA